jgi:hypothetical protein
MALLGMKGLKYILNGESRWRNKMEKTEMSKLEKLLEDIDKRNEK